MIVKYKFKAHIKKDIHFKNKKRIPVTWTYKSNSFNGREFIHVWNGFLQNYV